MSRGWHGGRGSEELGVKNLGFTELIFDAIEIKLNSIKNVSEKENR